MTKRIRGTPDRSVYETDTFGGGAGGGGDVVVLNPDDISSVNLLLILSELGNILTQLQSTLTATITGEVEVKNDLGNEIPVIDLILQGKIPDEEGVWDYVAGISGTEIIPAGGRVIGIAVSVTGAGATVEINGGDPIPIPWISGTVQGVEIAPRANLVAPTIVFSGTAAYLVEYLT